MIKFKIEHVFTGLEFSGRIATLRNLLELQLLIITEWENGEVII